MAIVTLFFIISLQPPILIGWMAWAYNLSPSRRTNRSATGRSSGAVVAGGSRRASPTMTWTAASGRASRRLRPPWWPTRNTCTSSICRGGWWLLRQRPRRTRSRAWTRSAGGAMAGSRSSRCSATWWTGRPGSQSWRWPLAPCRRTGRRSHCGPRSTVGVRPSSTGARQNRRGLRTLKFKIVIGMVYNIFCNLTG